MPRTHAKRSRPGRALVFISHVAEDVYLAKAIHLWLRKNAPDWLDFYLSGEATPGASPSNESSEALKRARVLVILITPNTADSPELLYEFGLGSGRDLPIIPIFVGLVKSDLPKSMRELKPQSLVGRRRQREVARMIFAHARASLPRRLVPLRLPRGLVQSYEKSHYRQSSKQMRKEYAEIYHWVRYRSWRCKKPRALPASVWKASQWFLENVPVPDKATPEDEALVALQILDGLLAWAYHEPTKDGAPMHRHARAISKWAAKAGIRTSRSPLVRATMARYGPGATRLLLPG